MLFIGCLFGFTDLGGGSWFFEDFARGVFVGLVGYGFYFADRIAYGKFRHDEPEASNDKDGAEAK